MNPLISIIIPTWNNLTDLTPCVNSIVRTGVLDGLGELIIVNNGDMPITHLFSHIRNTRVIEAGENLGWERALKRGIEETTTPYLCFQNDDTVIPAANRNFYLQLLYPFKDPNVAAVGPATTTAAGWHSIFRNEPLTYPTAVSYLIFFTVMVERQALLNAGGIDISAPGGDDLDLSIRLGKIGKTLVINPDAFIIHHGFRSGSRLRGDHTKFNGWNSPEMTDTTNQWLIQKHGFRTFIETTSGFQGQFVGNEPQDTEGDVIRAYVPKDVSVAELGCGAQKTVPWAIGIDRVEHGEMIPHVYKPSVADIVADVSKDLPASLWGKFDVVIARHVLEHCVDTVKTIREWSRLLKENGRLIIAVPNQDVANTIPMNPEHVHGFTPQSLREIMNLCGFYEEKAEDPKNGVSFVSVYRKVSMASLTKTSSDNLEVTLCLK